MYYIAKEETSEPQMKVRDLIECLEELDQNLPVKTALIDQDAKNASIAGISHITESVTLDPDEEPSYVIIPQFL